MVARHAAASAQAAGAGPREAAAAAAAAVTQRHVDEIQRHQRAAARKRKAKAERQRQRLAARQLKYEAKGMSPEEALRIAASELGMAGQTFASIVMGTDGTEGNGAGAGHASHGDAGNAAARYARPGGLRDQEAVAAEMVASAEHSKARQAYLTDIPNRHHRHHRASVAILDGTLDRGRAPAAMPNA